MKNTWCERCNEIANISLENRYHKYIARDIIPWWTGETYLPERVQCSECGCLWEFSRLRTLRFFKLGGKPFWQSPFEGPLFYVPITCSQHKCSNQATFRLPHTKRKYKCNLHAGVCIIA